MMMFFYVVDEAAFGIESDHMDYVQALLNSFNNRRRSRFGSQGETAVSRPPGGEYTFVESLASRARGWDQTVMSAAHRHLGGEGRTLRGCSDLPVRPRCRRARGQLPRSRGAGSGVSSDEFGVADAGRRGSALECRTHREGQDPVRSTGRRATRLAAVGSSAGWVADRRLFGPK